MNEQLKTTDVWALDQAAPSGHHHRQRADWSVPASSVSNHKSDSQRYLLKRAIGIVGQGMTIEYACARVWGPDAVNPALIQELTLALAEEK